MVLFLIDLLSIRFLAEFVGSFKWERTAKSFADGYHWHHMVFHHYIFPDLKFPIPATVKSCRFYATRKGKGLFILSESE